MLVAVETGTLNCPTFCELLSCSVGWVPSLYRHHPAWACVHHAQGPPGGWGFLSNSLTPSRAVDLGTPGYEGNSLGARKTLLSSHNPPSASLEFLWSQSCVSYRSAWQSGKGVAFSFLLGSLYRGGESLLLGHQDEIYSHLFHAAFSFSPGEQGCL